MVEEIFERILIRCILRNESLGSWSGVKISAHESGANIQEAKRQYQYELLVCYLEAMKLEFFFFLINKTIHILLYLINKISFHKTLKKNFWVNSKWILALNGV